MSRPTMLLALKLSIGSFKASSKLGISPRFGVPGIEPDLGVFEPLPLACGTTAAIAGGFFAGFAPALGAGFGFAEMEASSAASAASLAAFASRAAAAFAALSTPLSAFAPFDQSAASTASC